jgi:hypothetical protein
MSFDERFQLLHCFHQNSQQHSLTKSYITLMANWSFKAHSFLDAPASSTFKNCTFYPHCIYGFYIYLSTHSNFALYNLKWLDFITEMKSVYCALGTGSLNNSLWFVFKELYKCISYQLADLIEKADIRKDI